MPVAASPPPFFFLSTLNMGSQLSTPKKLKQARPGRQPEAWLWAGEIADHAGLPVGCVRRHLMRRAPFFTLARQRMMENGKMEWCAPVSEVRRYLGSKVEALLSLGDAAFLVGMEYSQFARYVREGLVRHVVVFGNKRIPESALNELPREVPVELRRPVSVGKGSGGGLIVRGHGSGAALAAMAAPAGPPPRLSFFSGVKSDSEGGTSDE